LAKEKAKRKQQNQSANDNSSSNVPNSSSGDSNNENSNNGSSSNADSGGNDVQIQHGDGSLNWPVDGGINISSGYGYRGFNGGGFHYGLDFAKPKGTPVYAAESGVVTRASFSPSYGNVVYIYHPDLDLATVYAHMTGYNVTFGSKVSSGQQVGSVGN